MIIFKILTVVASLFCAFYIVKFREKIVRIVGKAEWAERYLGMGGTYTMWIMIAVLIVLIAVFWLVGLPGVGMYY